MIADKVGETACTFLTGLYRAEQSIADRLIRIVNGRLPSARIDPDKAVPWVEARSRRQLAESQRDAIRLALSAKALVITGGPGVGKTADAGRPRPGDNPLRARDPALMLGMRSQADKRSRAASRSRSIRPSSASTSLMLRAHRILMRGKEEGDNE